MSSVRSIAVVGLQWGDEGKGKIVDYLADDFAAVVRFNGGSNAGHTVVVGGKKRTFHLLPSGAVRGKKLLIGPGVALDPLILSEELELLSREGFRVDLTVDGRCTTVGPLEKEMDELLEEMRGSKALGTTRRGIGPSYALRALRLTPRAMDLLSGDFDLAPAVSFYKLLGKKSPGLRRWAARARSVLRGRVGDASRKVVEMTDKGEPVLFEGSQGTLLDLYHGSYPYVTSSHTVASYVSASLGLSNDNISALGVMKCYTTRVGAGPFPTEVDKDLSDSFRKVGNEYGATTGRPRRVGWMDLVALRYAIRVNGAKKVVLSKVDVLSKIRKLRVCVGYSVDGRKVSDFYEALPTLGRAKPEYVELDSLFGSEIGGSGWPPPVKKLIDFLEDALRVRVTLVSYGEDRSRTRAR